MPSKLILDPSEPGINEVVAGAKVGTPIVLRELTIVPTIVSAEAFEADVTKVAVDMENDAEAMPTGEAPNVDGMPMPSDEGGFDKGSM